MRRIKIRWTASEYSRNQVLLLRLKGYSIPAGTYLSQVVSLLDDPEADILAEMANTLGDPTVMELEEM